MMLVLRCYISVLAHIHIQNMWTSIYKGSNRYTCNKINETMHFVWLFFCTTFIMDPTKTFLSTFFHMKVSLYYQTLRKIKYMLMHLYMIYSLNMVQTNKIELWNSFKNIQCTDPVVTSFHLIMKYLCWPLFSEARPDLKYTICTW